MTKTGENGNDPRQWMEQLHSGMLFVMGSIAALISFWGISSMATGVIFDLGASG
jgi:hypothetical protein